LVYLLVDQLALLLGGFLLLLLLFAAMVHYYNSKVCHAKVAIVELVTRNDEVDYQYETCPNME
jgi:hypothetical protein